MMLIINIGSSSWKFCLFDMNLKQIFSGKIRLDVSPHQLKYIFDKNEYVYLLDDDHNNHVDLIIKFLINKKIIKKLEDITYFGIRAVYVKNFYGASAFLNNAIYNDLNQHTDLCPIHNQNTIMLINDIKHLNTSAKIIIIFDNWFHRSINKNKYTIAIDQTIAIKHKIRKYGFHGISFSYSNKIMQNYLGKQDVNLIILHLGSGSSVCAIKNGKSFDTSMSYSPLSGIIMNTRSGDIDPSVLLTLKKVKNQSLKQLILFLNQQSGLYGLTKHHSISEVVNNLHKKNNQLALEMYTDSIVDYFIKYLNHLQKIDAIVFSGGISEFEHLVLEKIISKIHLINLEINDHLILTNTLNKISTPKSQIPIYLCLVNEEHEIAYEMLNLINKTK